MKRKRRAETTIETHRILVVKRLERPISARCAQCSEQTMWVTPEEAAVVARKSTRTIYGLIEEGALHYLDLPAGILICLNSLGTGTDGVRLEPESKLIAD